MNRWVVVLSRRDPDFPGFERSSAGAGRKRRLPIFAGIAGNVWTRARRERW